MTAKKYLHLTSALSTVDLRQQPSTQRLRGRVSRCGVGAGCGHKVLVEVSCLCLLLFPGVFPCARPAIIGDGALVGPVRRVVA